MSRTMTDKLMVSLNAWRGKVYPEIGYLMFADIRGDGANIKSLWVVNNEQGGVAYSELNGKTARERCNKLRKAIAVESAKISTTIERVK